jgi:hypothetical protein
VQRRIVGRQLNPVELRGWEQRHLGASYSWPRPRVFIYFERDGKVRTHFARRPPHLPRLDRHLWPREHARTSWRVGLVSRCPRQRADRTRIGDQPTGRRWGQDAAGHCRGPKTMSSMQVCSRQSRIYRRRRPIAPFRAQSPIRSACRRTPRASGQRVREYGTHGEHLQEAS